MFSYAARNALLPNVTAFGMALGFVISGALVTEIVFSYPGLGYQLLTAVRNLDYPLMQGIFLMITFAVLAREPDRRPALRAARSARARVVGARWRGIRRRRTMHAVTGQIEAVSELARTSRRSRSTDTGQVLPLPGQRRRGLTAPAWVRAILRNRKAAVGVVILVALRRRRLAGPGARARRPERLRRPPAPAAVARASASAPPARARTSSPRRSGAAAPRSAVGILGRRPDDGRRHRRRHDRRLLPAAGSTTCSR